MDILKRSLAPMTDEAWAEINDQAKKTLLSTLTARRFVDVAGPKGWEYAASSLGRLDIPENQPARGVRYGIHRVQALIETRVPFELEIWELDNIIRGAKDVELQPLIEAAQKIALFEEEAIYTGFKEGNIVGIAESVKHEAIPATDNPSGFLEAIFKGVTVLTEASVGGPYALVVNPDIWAMMSGSTQGYPLRKRVEDIIGGEMIPCPTVDDAFLISLRGGDLELVIGQDFSIGYKAHDGQKVRLFLTESFTFRVLDPSVILLLSK
jgi:uncharacterized linocin/CFP29 family protein